MNFRHATRAVIAGILIAAGSLVSGTPAQAATCSAATTQDFDDDGHADLVVARTLPTNRAGVIDIRMTGGTTQTISAKTLGFSSAANDQFGASVQIATIDESDDCSDLVIGAPGTAGGGAVYLVRGTGSGVDTSAIRLVSPAANAGFGATVASMYLPLTRVRVLVGAPGMDVGTATDTGAVLVYSLDDGTPAGSPTALTYSDFGAAPVAADHLGAVMDVDHYHVTLGVPDRTWVRPSNAGEAIGFTLVDEPGRGGACRCDPGEPEQPGCSRRRPRPVTASAVTLTSRAPTPSWAFPGEDIGTRRRLGRRRSLPRGR